MLFCLLLSLGIAIAGATAYFMTWPLVSTQVRDRHAELLPDIAGGLFAPASFYWLLAARYRRANDAGLDFLGLPASIGAWSIAIGGLGVLVFGLITFWSQA